MDAQRPLRRLAPDELDVDQRALYESIIGGRRASGSQRSVVLDEQGRLQGPFNAFLLQPRLGDRLQALGGEIRFRTTMTDREREIAILIVATHWSSDFERYAHEAVGRSVGLTDAELDAIRAGDDSVWTTPNEIALVRIVRALVTDGDLDDSDYAASIEAFGAAGLFELLTLIGYYATLALQLRVFRVPAPDEQCGR